MFLASMKKLLHLLPLLPLPLDPLLLFLALRMLFDQRGASLLPLTCVGDEQHLNALSCRRRRNSLVVVPHSREHTSNSSGLQRHEAVLARWHADVRVAPFHRHSSACTGRDGIDLSMHVRGHGRVQGCVGGHSEYLPILHEHTRHVPSAASRVAGEEEYKVHVVLVLGQLLQVDPTKPSQASFSLFPHGVRKYLCRYPSIDRQLCKILLLSPCWSPLLSLLVFLLPS
mmetsp:Transcript_10297/g.34379  ORF Transcript_10297/g.34379 Transcript_10297/m.34379 type:complete len:227 (-) Transcript_10297:84-764(-)